MIPIKKYLANMLFPPHYIVITLFDTVEYKHYKYMMNNIYISAEFFKSDYNNEKKLMTHGVMRKGMRGTLLCFKQYEFKSNKDHIQASIKEKSEVTEVDPNCTNLIETSVYDNNTVHQIRMVSE